MKCIFNLIFILFCTGQIFAQLNISGVISVPTIEDGITMVEKKRMTRISFHNIPAIFKMLNTKIHVEHSNYNSINYSILYPRERTILQFWIGDYSTIIRNIIQDNDYHNDWANSGDNEINLLLESAFPDFLFQQLIDTCHFYQDVIKQRISDIDIPDKDKEFLLLYLKSILVYKNIETFVPDSIVMQSDFFLQQYSDTIYSPYISTILCPQYKKTSLSFDASIQAGYIRHTDSLEHYFGHSGLTVGYFRMNWHRFFAEFRFYLSLAGKINTSFTRFTDENELWDKGKGYRALNGGFASGVHIVDNQYCRISPWGGVYQYQIFTSFMDEDTKKTKSVSIKYFPGWTTGIDIVWKLKHYHSSGDYNSAFRAQYENQYSYLIFSAGYNSPFLNHDYSPMKGNQLFVSLGAGIAIQMVRKKKF